MERNTRNRRGLLIAVRISNLLMAGGCCDWSGEEIAGGKIQMRLTQKRLQTRTAFTFGETELTYSFEDRESRQEYVVDYFQLSRTRRHAARRDWSRLQFALVLAAAGATTILTQTLAIGFQPLALLWLSPSALYLALFLFRQTHFLVVQSPEHQLLVIDDRSRQAIVAELDRRRRERIADIYGNINLANEAYLEIRKIEWLVEEAVLTRDQADDQIRTVNGVAIARSAAAQDVRDSGRRTMFEREAIAV